MIFFLSENKESDVIYIHQYIKDLAGGLQALMMLSTERVDVPALALVCHLLFSSFSFSRNHSQISEVLASDIRAHRQSLHTHTSSKKPTYL